MARRYVNNERKRNTLQTTALIIEAYLSLVDVKNAGLRGRAQFFALSAPGMRRILPDAERARGAGEVKLGADEVAVPRLEKDESVVALHDALGAFAKIAPRQAQEDVVAARIICPVPAV